MKALLVASASSVQREIVAIIVARNHDLDIAADSAQAIHLLAASAYDLIVVAGGGLLPACRAIHAQAPDAACLVFLEKDHPIDLVRLLEAGVSDWCRDLGELSVRFALAEARIREGEDRREHERRMLASERLASMGSLASCIAHEIANPLTYVIGNLSYAARGLAELTRVDSGDKPHKIGMAIADAREGVERVRSVLADLVALSRPEQEDQRVIDVRRVLESAIGVARNEIRHRARLERQLDEVPPVLANEVRLQNVLLTLLLGVARTIPEGSAGEQAIVVSTSTDGRRARIQIRIASEPSNALLERGWRSAEENVGSSLAISNTIVAGIGGELIIERDDAREIGFTVLLPGTDGALDPLPEQPIALEAVRRRARIEEVDAGLRESAPVPARRARILVVDDEPVIASTMRRALEGHEIYVVTSGRDALELCRGQAFDLVLCDLMIPDLTGMDLYEQLRRDDVGSEKKIIFMTGGAFTERARKFLSGVPWVEKPFDVDEIQSVIDAYFRREARVG